MQILKRNIRKIKLFASIIKVMFFKQRTVSLYHNRLASADDLGVFIGNFRNIVYKVLSSGMLYLI